MNPLYVFKLIMRKWVFVIGTFILAIAATLFVMTRIPSAFSSNALILIPHTPTHITDIVQQIDSATITPADLVQLSSTHDVVMEVQAGLGIHSKKDVITDLYKLNVCQLGNNLLQINAEAALAQRSARIVNRFADVLTHTASRLDKRYRDKYSLKIIQKAMPISAQENTPSVKVNVIFGAIVGFFLGCVIALIAGLSDDGISAVDDVEARLGIQRVYRGLSIPAGAEILIDITSSISHSENLESVVIAGLSDDVIKTCETEISNSWATIKGKSNNISLLPIHLCDTEITELINNSGSSYILAVSQDRDTAKSIAPWLDRLSRLGYKCVGAILVS